MANDFKSRQPTKTERVIYEIAMRMDVIDRNTFSNSAHLCALGIVLGVAPEKIAELLVSGGDQIQDYGKKINEAIDKLEGEKKDKANVEVSESNA
jgi:hypothetical protein